jgi:hypothetical protein
LPVRAPSASVMAPFANLAEADIEMRDREIEWL